MIWKDSWHWMMPPPGPCRLLSAGSVILNESIVTITWFLWSHTQQTIQMFSVVGNQDSGFAVVCCFAILNMKGVHDSMTTLFQRFEDSSIKHRPLPSCCLHLVTTCCAHLTNAPLPSGQIRSWWYHHVTTSCYIGDTRPSCSDFKCFSNTLTGLSSYIIQPHTFHLPRSWREPWPSGIP